MSSTSNQHFLIRNRNMRNELLNQTDKFLLSDYPILEEQKQEMITYRQTLREFININESKYLNEGISFIEFPKPPVFFKVDLPKY